MTSMRVITRATVALGWGLMAMVAVGCGGRPAALERPLTITGPLEVGKYVAYLDHGRERLVFVRPVTREVRTVELGRRPSFIETTPDHRRVLVVCKGWMAQSRDEEDAPPSLYVVDPEHPDAVQVHELGSPFDRVALSSDGRYAVAYFAASTQPSEEELFRNPNAVALLDLGDESGDATPVEKTVRSFGGVPIGVLFSPPTMAPVAPNGDLGEQRTLAVVFATGYVTFLDMAHPERSEVTVRLTPPGETQTVEPAQMVFAPEAGTIFLRAQGSNDIFAFTLMARQPDSASKNDFVVSINTLAAGSVPADLGVFMDRGERKVLVANQGSRDLTVIDAFTSQFVNLEVGDPVDRVVLWPPEAPEVAILFSQASPRYRIHFLDLADVEARQGQNLDVLETDQAVMRVELIPDRAQALVLHDDARSVLSLLDLRERTLSPVTSRGALGGYAYTTGGDQLVGFAWGEELLGFINLNTLAVRPLQLAYPPLAVMSLRPVSGVAGDAETRAVVVDHGGPGGLLTVIPSPGVSSREDTYVLSGFLLEGLFGDRWEE